MSTPDNPNMTETIEVEETDEQQWSRAAILRKLPDRMTDLQKNVLVAAVRNPDAEFAQIGELANCQRDRRSQDARHTLRSYARGSLAAYGPTDVHEIRGEQTTAKSFEELTPKQKAVIDYCARHGVLSIAGNYDVSAEAIVDAIRANGGPKMHATWPYHVVNQYPNILKERYDYYESRGELEAGEIDGSADPLLSMNARELLEEGGYPALPDENLDELPDVKHGNVGNKHAAKKKPADETDDNTVSDATTETETETETTTETETEPDDSGGEVGELDVVSLPDSARRRDVQWRTPYYARVEKKYNQMALVALHQFGEDDSDVVGAVYDVGMPDPFTIADLAVGDDIVVGLYKRHPDGKLVFNVLETVDMLHGVHFSHPERLALLPDPTADEPEPEAEPITVVAEADDTDDDAEPEPETDAEPELSEETEADIDESREQAAAGETVSLDDVRDALDEARRETADDAVRATEAVEALEARVSALESKLDAVETDLTDAASNMVGTSNDLADELRKRMRNLEGGVAEQIDELNERLDEQPEPAPAAEQREAAPGGVGFVVAQLETLAHDGYEIVEYERSDSAPDEAVVHVRVAKRGDDE